MHSLETIVATNAAAVKKPNEVAVVFYQGGFEQFARYYTMPDSFEVDSIDGELLTAIGPVMDAHGCLDREEDPDAH